MRSSDGSERFETIVSVARTANSESIFAVKHIYGIPCRIEPRRPGKLGLLCRRCCKPGHTARFCARPFVCGFCAGGHYSNVCEHHEISEICSNVPEMVQKLREEVQSRFKNLEEDKYYCLSTLLDPRFRTRFFAQENYELVRRKLFLEAIQRSDPDAESSSEDEATNRGRPPQNVSNFLVESHVTFWNCYEELASTNPVNSENSKSPIAVELDSCEAESLLPRNQSPFNWWAKYKSKYAHLANLARVFLSAPEY